MLVRRLFLFYGWRNCFRAGSLRQRLIWRRRKVAPWQVQGGRRSRP